MTKQVEQSPYGLSLLFALQWRDIAEIFLTLGKNAAYHPAEIIG